jgi:DNA mismatch endonuclease, patch repair protein
MDTVDTKTRSKIMASVGQKNTGAEMILRRLLHKAGLRYRLHDRKLPGSPDLVFPRYAAVVFVHGCYWHAHDCYRGTKPKSRQQFWKEKFEANKRRDAMNVKLLTSKGWRVLTIWECALKGKTALPQGALVQQVEKWLREQGPTASIAGNEIVRA